MTVRNTIHTAISIYIEYRYLYSVIVVDKKHLKM